MARNDRLRTIGVTAFLSITLTVASLASTSAFNFVSKDDFKQQWEQHMKLHEAELALVRELVGTLEKSTAREREAYLGLQSELTELKEFIIKQLSSGD